MSSIATSVVSRGRGNRGSRITWAFDNESVKGDAITCPHGRFTVAVTGLFLDDCTIELAAVINGFELPLPDVHNIEVRFTEPGLTVVDASCDLLVPRVTGNANGVSMHIITEGA